MAGWYFLDLVDVLEGAGVRCRISDTNAGWESRARASGGFAVVPYGNVFHHTASSASAESDLNWMIHGSDDAPIGNMLLDRDGVVWPIAAGGANTQGKGGPAEFSRGTVAVDQGNSRLWAIEAANAGTGEAWPVQQIDAYFAASNAINEYLGNLPADVITHALGTGEGWTDRKIDPATAAAVRGPWVPFAVTSSGTWSLDDIRAECTRRAGGLPIPPPEPSIDIEEYDMAFIIQNTGSGEIALIYGDRQMCGLAGQDLPGYEAHFGPIIPTDPVVWQGFLEKSQ